VTGLLLVYLGICFAICKSAKVWKQVHANRSVVLNTKNVLVSNRSIHVQDVFAASVAHDLRSSGSFGCGIHDAKPEARLEDADLPWLAGISWLELGGCRKRSITKSFYEMLGGSLTRIGDDRSKYCLLPFFQVDRLVVAVLKLWRKGFGYPYPSPLFQMELITDSVGGFFKVLLGRGKCVLRDCLLREDGNSIVFFGLSHRFAGQPQLLPQENIGSDIGDENQASENGDNYISPVRTVVRNVLLYAICAALVFVSYWALVVRGRWIVGSIALITSIFIFWHVVGVIFTP
jgi:hypothetical protein